MSKKIRTIVASLMIAFGLVFAPVAFGGVSFASTKDEACDGVSGIGGGNACTRDSDAGNKLGNFIGKINNILLYIIGAIAVVVIIIGGISYVTSGGDQSKVTSAKNTILYAVVGLVIAIMAFAIVNFILKNI